MNQLEITPTVQFLNDSRYEANIVDSPFRRAVQRQGKEFVFYEDNSVLIFDSHQQIYHFITAEGRQQGRRLRSLLQPVVSEMNLSTLSLHERGRGGYATVFDAPSEFSTGAEVVIRVIESQDFMLSELAEKKDREEIRASRVRKMSIKDVLAFRQVVMNSFIENGEGLQDIRMPMYFGFSVRSGSIDPKAVAFLDFMEKIPYPTVHNIDDIVNASVGRSTTSTSTHFIPFIPYVQTIAREFFGGNMLAMRESILGAATQFANAVRKGLPTATDVESRNIFFIGFNKMTGKPEFVLTDIYELQPISSNII